MITAGPHFANELGQQASPRGQQPVANSVPNTQPQNSGPYFQSLAASGDFTIELPTKNVPFVNRTQSFLAVWQLRTRDATIRFAFRVQLRPNSAPDPTNAA